MSLKASTSDGSLSSDGPKSHTGGLSPGIEASGSGRLPGSTALAMNLLYRTPRGLGPFTCHLAVLRPKPKIWEIKRRSNSLQHDARNVQLQGPLSSVSGRLQSRLQARLPAPQVQISTQ